MYWLILMWLLQSCSCSVQVLLVSCGRAEGGANASCSTKEPQWYFAALDSIEDWLRNSFEWLLPNSRSTVILRVHDRHKQALLSEKTARDRIAAVYSADVFSGYRAGFTTYIFALSLYSCKYRLHAPQARSAIRKDSTWPDSRGKPRIQRWCIFPVTEWDSPAALSSAGV